MLPPRGILKTPRQVPAAAPRSAGPAGIEVTYAQAVLGSELVVNLSQILVEVVRGRYIALPSGVAIGQRNIRRWDEVTDDLHRHWIHTIRTDHIRDAVADERCVSSRIGGLGRGSCEIADALQGGGNASAAQECARRLTQS